MDCAERADRPCLENEALSLPHALVVKIALSVTEEVVSLEVENVDWGLEVAVSHKTAESETS